MTITAPSVQNEVAESVAGQVLELAPSQVAAAFPTLSTITPTATFNFPWNGSIVQFTVGVRVPVLPDLLAAITTANAPFTTP